MICPRCGTEHQDPQKICPRCGYGRRKIRKKMPRWARWTSVIAGILLIFGAGFLFFRAHYYDADWMNGSWEGGDLAVTFNAEDNTFLLSNGDLVLNGNYIARRDSFDLMADDGNAYFFHYNRVGVKKMRVSFMQNDTTVRVMLTHMDADDGEIAETAEETEPDADF